MFGGAAQLRRLGGGGRGAFVFLLLFLLPLPFHSEKVEGIEKEEVKQVLLKDHSGGEEENKNKSGIYCLTNKSTPRVPPTMGTGGEE